MRLSWELHTWYAEAAKKKQHMSSDLCTQPCKNNELRLMVFIDDINTCFHKAAHSSCATDPFDAFSKPPDYLSIDWNYQEKCPCCVASIKVKRRVTMDLRMK